MAFFSTVPFVFPLEKMVVVVVQKDARGVGKEASIAKGLDES